MIEYVKCNNCNTITLESDLEGFDGSDGHRKGCPVCKIDHYLMDVNVVPKGSTLMYSKLINYKYNGLFFGKRNIARLDLNTNERIANFKNSLQSQMWLPSDFDIATDAIPFALMNEQRRTQYLKNLKFQTMADSLATRAIVECFLKITSDPELESYWVWHSFTENIHSQSYADIIKALPVDASKEFDTILDDDNIMNRSKTILQHFDNLAENPNKETLLLGLFALVVLEGALFQSSFVTSYAFAEEHNMTETGKVIQRIDLDENVHLATGKYLIKYLLKEKEYQEIYDKNLPTILDMFKLALCTDETWADYVLDVPLRKLNSDSMKQYIRYNMYELMNYLKLPNIVSRTTNPFTWLTKYKNTKNLQISLNETSGTNYLLGALDKELDTNTLFGD